jgi:putative polyketide hydroxylase
MVIETNVLIVGGGLNGLTSALLLAHRGISCLVAERHPSTSIQYKFAGISPRSMEIFRALGIEDEIRAQRTGDQQAGGVARAKTLSDPEVHWMMDSAWPDVTGLSASNPATCDQHVLEPILRAHAERRGADVRFNTEVVSLAESGDRMEGILRDRSSGEEATVSAAHAVVADGANGTFRNRLGIGRSGPGVLQHWMNIIFDTNLSPFLQGKRFTSCFVTNLNATFTPRESGRWLLALQYDPEGGERPEAFDAQRCRDLVRAGAGKADVTCDLVDARPWEVAAAVADRFQVGHAFLVGDAAHVMPPTGAFGGNTGIHDAHNLAWKLAFVLNGHADAALLDTYDAERRPVVLHTLNQALARLQHWFKDPKGRLPPSVEMVDGYDVIFGQRYRDGAVIPDEPIDDAEAPFEQARALSGRPGTRAPHVTLLRDGRGVPIHDLFDREYVLLAGAEGSDWATAADRVRAEIGCPIVAHRIGRDTEVAEADATWRQRYGITDRGAVVVRPDGSIAWRSVGTSPDCHATLTDVFTRLAGRAKASRERN